MVAPTSPAEGEVKVRRGGSWHTWALYARCSYRNWNSPDTRYTLVGMRLLREIGPDHQGRIGTLHGGDRARLGHATERKMLDGLSLRTITGYACACPDVSAPARPSVVVDPFGGTGTTSLVADVLGRIGITVDRSADYCRLARWRTADPAERARALGVPKPPPVPEGQGSLFDELEAS